MISDSNPRGLPADTRGLAVGVIGFVAMIVIAALMYIMFEPAVGEMLGMSLDQASNQDVKDAINLRQQIFGGMLFFALFLSGVYLIARAVREGGVR
jgi:hypothetical protein